MAHSSVVAKQLDDVMQCPICLKVFTNPRVLPCIHTFCLHCIEGWGKDKLLGDSAACPVCRKEFTVPQNGFADLPKNFFVQSLLEVRKLCSAEAAKETTCDVCSSDETSETSASAAVVASTYCADCQQNLCKQCSLCHKKLKGCSSHQTVELGTDQNLEGFLPKLSSASCEQHSQKSIELFCLDCKLPACVECFVEYHNKHHCSNVDRISKEFRAQIESDSVRCETAVADCRELLQKVVKEREVFDKLINDATIEIGNSAEQLHRKIETGKSKLLGELSALKEKRVKEMETVKEELEHHLTALESFNKYCEEVRTKATDCDVTRTATGLHDRAVELLQFDAVKHVADSFQSNDVRITSRSLSTDENLVGNIVVSDRPLFASNYIPTLAHVSPKGSGVLGVTSLRDKLFVVRENSCEVEVYSIDTLALERRLAITGLGPAALGLAACGVNNCLYISDTNNNRIHRVELSNTSSIKTWPVATEPNGLSVNSVCNVVVVCIKDQKLHEFTTTGALVKEIRLKSGISHPRQVAQLPTGQYVISHGGSSHRLCLVGEDGQMLQSYGGSKGSSIGQLNEPRGVAVDEYGSVFIADRDNNRVLIIDKSFTRAYQLPLFVDGGLHDPYCICLDQTGGRIYVGEDRGGRMLVFDLF